MVPHGNRQHERCLVKIQFLHDVEAMLFYRSLAEIQTKTNAFEILTLPPLARLWRAGLLPDLESLLTRPSLSSGRLKPISLR
jgi:hypothetical protein